MPEKKSYPIIKTPEKVEISYKQNGNTVSMTSGKMTVTLDVATGKVTYTDPQGETLLKEKVEGTNFIPRKDVNRDAYTVSQAFSLEPEEAIYGLGQYQNGIMNYRGISVLLLQAYIDIVYPILISTLGFGVL